MEERKHIFDQDCTELHFQSAFVPLKCSACGTESQRERAKFCLTCGHDLHQDYAPLDLLRASYNLRKQTEKRNVLPLTANENQSLFSKNRNGASALAIAFAVYSLVPYLGILFCPGSLVFGGIGLAVSFQKPQFGGRQTAVYSLLFGSMILAAQILLWWLLYLIPAFKK